jgi:phage-related protein
LTILKYVYLYSEAGPEASNLDGLDLRDLRSFPEAVRRDIGQALYTAQQRETDPAAKPPEGLRSDPEEVEKGHSDTTGGH